MKIFSVIFATIVLFTSTTSVVSAHSGGTDANGCHNQTSTGTFHCHRSRSVGGSSSGGDSEGADIGLILAAIGAVALTFYFVDRKSQRYAFTPTLLVNDAGVSQAGIGFKFRF